MVFLRGEVRRAVFLCIDTSKQKRKKLRKFPVFDLTQKKGKNKDDRSEYISRIG